MLQLSGPCPGFFLRPQAGGVRAGGPMTGIHMTRPCTAALRGRDRLGEGGLAQGVSCQAGAAFPRDGTSLLAASALRGHYSPGGPGLHFSLPHSWRLVSGEHAAAERAPLEGQR